MNLSFLPDGPICQRIIDLSVSIDVRKNDTFDFLLSKALEEKENNFDIEKVMFGI